MDPRIEILILKLVYTKHFMIFGDARRELKRFENFVFTIQKRVYNKKKLNRFEIALNFAEQLLVSSFLYI
jgi:hypothetical protein